MTNNQLNRERLEKIKSWRETYGAGSNVMLPAEEAEALAAMDSEPVAEVLSNRPGNDTSTIDRALPVGTQLYLHAQPEPVVPDGYVMVPKEPTEAMCDISHIGVDVYCGITDDNEYYSIGGAEAAKVWKAMLAAAPQEVKGE
ncbi:TPA: hypothetical protein MCR07_003988 [Klebsiella pneumoniae]|uniref:hypothetical protein n=1 Tax=Klebsiella pneumoniae TaxID=573 RepID=UPI000B52E28D|nr:hypothetical protein [Klebsiella pneumoniae]HDU5121056.1 hypothetical protein [Klebsiella pneumoniae subsp. pneumoniae]EIV5340130.1 hypothetical protein [Klebsiella pneumoniae]EKX8353992.1 hypothetical protein [Klebsiella pneumoniae]OWV47693.1 hypothetical protein CDD88_26325 [Klebsiella pneumoniae]PXG38476.1 hypothetical protein DMP39_21755 [Klebsiella pneumoniae]